MKDDIKNKIYSLVKEYFSDETLFQTDRVSVGFPCFDHNEIISAMDSLLDLRLSQGPKVKKFEGDFSAYLGMNYGVAVNSGSSANLLAIQALIRTGRVKPGSEVILPAATFATVASPILQCGLIPVFVDIDDKTYNIQPSSIESAINENTGLIMVVHSLGCAAQMDEIELISNKYNIPIMEDCCEAHGSEIFSKKIGSFGIVSTWSFFVAHNMTSGEGGMINTDDDEINECLISIREFGRLKEQPNSLPRFHYSDEFMKDYDERYVFTQLGYNLRMSDIHASLGIEQLKKLDLINKKRNKVVDFYNENLIKHSNYLQLPTVPKDSFHSFYGYPLLVKKNKLFKRVDIVRYIEDNNIETRGFMGGDLSQQPAFRNEKNVIIKGSLKNTINIFENSFFIGCHPNITEVQQQKVVDVINRFMSSFDI